MLSSPQEPPPTTPRSLVGRAGELSGTQTKKNEVCCSQIPRYNILKEKPNSMQRCIMQDLMNEPHISIFPMLLPMSLPPLDWHSSIFKIPVQQNSSTQNQAILPLAENTVCLPVHLDPGKVVCTGSQEQV